MPQLAISIGITAGLTAVQYLLAPRAKQQPVDKGKMEDVRIQGSDYGAIIPKTWGITRLAGNIIWADKVTAHTVTTGGGGGKKNPTPRTTNWIYTTSVQVLICRNQLTQFLRIWADADLLTANSGVYFAQFEAENGTKTGGASNFADGTASGGTAVQGLGSGGKVTFNTSTVADPPRPLNQDPDESVDPTTLITFYYKTATDKIATIDTDTISPINIDLPATDEWTGKTIIVSGFADSISYEYASAATANLDRIYIEKSWVTTPFPQFTISGIVDPTIGYPTDLDDPSSYYNYPPASVKNGTTGTYALTTPVPSETIRFYTGTETQTADAAIKAWADTRYGPGQGDLRISANRGESFAVFQDRTLKSNRIENFTFETDTGDATVNTILTDLFTECGLSGAEYNIAATNGLSQVGFLDHQKQSRRALVEMLERYHFFRIGEIDGKIYTIADSFDPSARLIDDDLLRAHNYGEEMPRYDAEVIQKEEHLLPREVRVSVMQPELEYHNEDVPAQLFTNISGKESKTYTFPIVDPASVARTTAEKLLLKEYSEATAYEFWGMPATAEYAIGDVVAVLINGSYRNVRIEKKQMTLPIGKIRFQCVSVNPFTPTYYQDDVTELAAKAIDQYVPSTFPRNSVAFVIPSVPIREADRGKLGVYLAISGRGRGNGNQAALYREMDDDNYVLIEQSLSSVPLGLCEDTLANHAGGTATEDITNVLDIWFFDDVTLETVTQADIDRLPLINLIRVGDEWVQFRTATAQVLEDNSPYRSKWRVSNLWRGRFNTSAKISTHAAKEYAAIVTPELYFFDLETADIGQSVSVKAVTNGQSVDLAPISTFTFDGASGRQDTLFEHYTDETTGSSSDESIYLDTLPKNTLAANGDSIVAEYSGIFDATNNSSILYLLFAGSIILASDDFVILNSTANSDHWKICTTITRVSNTTVRCTTSLAVTGYDAVVAYLQVASLTLATTAYDLELRAETATAGDITAKMAKGVKVGASA